MADKRSTGLASQPRTTLHCGMVRYRPMRATKLMGMHAARLSLASLLCTYDVAEISPVALQNGGIKSGTVLFRLCRTFSTVSSQKLPERHALTADERGHIAIIAVESTHAQLRSFYPQCHSRDKIFQAFHAFRTASDKSCAEAWE